MWNCAMREIEEETGLSVRLTKATPWVCVSDTIYFMFRVRDMAQLAIKDEAEVCDVCWKSFSDLREVNKNRALRLICSTRPESGRSLPMKYPTTVPLGPGCTL